MNEMVIIGKVINFFGIKGELKVLSDFQYKDKAFKCGNKVLIKEEELEITSVRYHKNYILIRVNNLDNINLITKYIGYNIYFRKMDLELDNKEYLLEDLIGVEVVEDDEVIGIVKEIYTTNNTNYVKVEYNNKEYLIPIIPVYIKSFAKEDKKLYTINAKSLII